jgi:hypothetical protein
MEGRRMIQEETMMQENLLPQTIEQTGLNFAV